MTQSEREAGLDRLSREFMRPDVYQSDVWEVQANHGETHLVPGDVVGSIEDPDDARKALADYVEGKIDPDADPVYRRNVWLARLSAPGYMDCTDWSAFGTREEAEEYLIDMYDDGEESDDDRATRIKRAIDMEDTVSVDDIEWLRTR